jgi:hypothetical protein
MDHGAKAAECRCLHAGYKVEQRGDVVGAFLQRELKRSQMTNEPFKLAVLWSGNRGERITATPHNNRYVRIFEELAKLDIRAEPAVYADHMASEVRDQLLQVHGVLVWVNPIFDDGNRVVLDALLREIASKGIWVSAHPDLILKMGTKDILHRTKHFGWGTDTELYRDAKEFQDTFASKLTTAGPRVLKQNRGYRGLGVWKVERLPPSPRSEMRVRVLEAARGSVPKDITLAAFINDCGGYFANDGCIIDQPFQARLSDGMIRCFMAADTVVGFAHQFITGLLIPAHGGPAPEPASRIYYPASASEFQALRIKMESEWVPQMLSALDLEPSSLPIIWDADFLYGPRTVLGEDRYVLCEINVSCVFPVPDNAPANIARISLARLSSR